MDNFGYISIKKEHNCLLDKKKSTVYHFLSDVNLKMMKMTLEKYKETAFSS